MCWSSTYSVSLDSGMRCAAFTVDPTGVTTDVVFFFPDRKSDLHLIDDIATGEKCLVPMYCGHADPHRAVSDLK